MRAAWSIAISLLIASSAVAADPSATVIRAHWLIDPATGQRHEHWEVLVENQHIRAVHATGGEVPAQAAVIDLGESTLLPGLIDTHTHLFLQGETPGPGDYDSQLLKHPASYRAARAVVSARRALKQGTWYVPTLQVYYTDWDPPDTPTGRRDRKRAEVHAVSFRKAMKAGVKMAFDTDVGGFSWSQPIAQEFGREVELGMTPLQALQSATTRAAELLERQGAIGTLAPGAWADVIAVTGDPLQDVNALKNVVFVMKNGAVFKSPPGH